MIDAFTSNVEIKSACPKPCSSCPWRLANQGSKPDPHKFYTKTNLARLWKGLRDGARMSCHPTDPRMAEFAGYEALSNRETTHECAGALMIQQREFLKYQALVQADPRNKRSIQIFQRAHPKSLTRYGLISIIERAMFGGSCLDRIAMSTPDLNDSEIGYPALEIINPKVKQT